MFGHSFQTLGDLETYERSQRPPGTFLCIFVFGNPVKTLTHAFEIMITQTSL